MTRIVFFGLPLHGHTNPTLPLVRELVSRGAQITYYSNEAFAEKIKLAGASFRSYHSNSLVDIASIPERMEQMPYLFMTAVRDVIGGEIARVRDEAPDIIIHDSVAPWGKCIAQLLGVPAVSSVTTFAFNSKVVRLGAGAKPKSFSAALSKVRHIAKALRVRKEIRKYYGVKGPALLDLYVGREQLNIVYTSTYFQPFAATFDHRYKFVGPLISDRREQTDFLLEEIADEKLVYVSLGTLFNEDEGFYRSCFAALGHTDCRVIVSTGGRTVEELGAVPGNFIVRSFVPQLEVLRRASAFITRGGMNSVSESLYFGVPVIVIPHMAEQMIVARRVEQLGAGVYVKKADATSRRIGEAMHRLMADEAYRRNSRLVGDSFRAAGGVKRAADEVLSVLAFR